MTWHKSSTRVLVQINAINNEEQRNKEKGKMTDLVTEIIKKNTECMIIEQLTTINKGPYGDK
jgi:hypothetical protein